MALVLADRVLETTTTAGSGTITLAGAKAGFQSFAAIGNGNTTYYTIAGQSGGEWEVGIGTYTASGTTLSRDTVLASSSNGAKVTFSAGTKDVFVDYPAETALYPNQSGNISALSGKIINLAAPEDDNDAATKLYVDDLVSTGLYYHDPVQLTTTSAFTGYSITYNNGTAGVSATITQASSYSSLTIDSTAAAVGNRILVKDAANAAYNGVYVVNNTGSGSTPWVMMRSTDADSYGTTAGNLSQNDYFYTQNGVANKGAAFVCSTEGVIIFGTTAINFAQFSSSQVYVAGTGIDITGVTVSLQTPVTVPNGGTGATTLTGYVKGNGASALSTVSTIPASDISGTLSISQGGTGSGTQQGAINALAGAVTSGYYLRGNGTNAVMSAIQVTDVPTLNQNTTGQAGSVANALTINNSGAGDASGATYNGSAAKTISYNSIGAAPSDGSTTITKLGTVTAGTWNASTIGVLYGGTGATTASGARTNLGLVIGTDVPSPTGTGASGTWSISINGNAATVTNGVYTSGSYADPTWITSLAGSKISGNISGNAANVTGIVAVANGGTGLTGGTSGGVLYYSAAGTIASSAALASNALVVGGGAGVAPSTITTGTGVVTALGVNTGSAGAFVVNGGALGTPSGGTLTNVTGLPISSGVSGLGTGVATALAVNTGSAGAFVVNGGALGTPSGGTLTNVTGLPISSGVSGLGTGVATALAVNTGSAGAFTTNNAANTFTAAQTFRAASAVRSEAASTQDAIVLAGRAGGTSSYAVTFTPATLSANRTVTLPDTTGTIILNTTNSGSNITLDTLFGGF